MVRLERTPAQLVNYLFEQVGEHYYDRMDVPSPGIRAEELCERMRQGVPQTLYGQQVRASLDERGCKYYLADGSWLLVRTSGTEPLLRLYAEARSGERVQELLRTGKELTGLADVPTEPARENKRIP
jgi:phosphomannomutase